jgi:beta-barrel assembly-enhancing protease
MQSNKLAILLLTAGLFSCASRQPGQALRPGFNMYSPEQDIELGRQAEQQVLRQVRVHPNRDVQEFVQQMGARLVATPAATNYPFRFTVIQEESINAFALPGGPVFIHSGLIRAASTEGELAGVIAHEIAHVVLRHGTSQASKANLVQLPAMLAGAALGNSAGALGQLGLSVALESVLLRYSRNAETEADALGARMMYEAGYDPLEMARFFQKLEESGGARAPEFLSSHPNPGSRVSKVSAEVRTFPSKRYQAGSGRFNEIQRMVS